MGFSASEEMRKFCRGFDVDIDPEALFGCDGRIELLVEAPASLGPGMHGIDLVGGFSSLIAGDPQKRSSYRNVHLVGRFCSIAAGVQIGLPEHLVAERPVHSPGSGISHSRVPETTHLQISNCPVIEQVNDEYQRVISDPPSPVRIGDDVRIGEGVSIRSGVVVGDGAIIEDGSSVHEDVPPYAIVAGVPAKVVSYRFEPDIVADLLELKWWAYGSSALESVDFTDMPAAMRRIRHNIQTGFARPYDAPILRIRDGSVEAMRYDRETNCLAELSSMACDVGVRPNTVQPLPAIDPAFRPKMIIWDLDDTLWQGCLAENDDLVLNERRAGFIVALNSHGVVSAICSKNDLEPAQRTLEQFGLWDAFVFPRIAFVPKGAAVRQLITDMQLQPSHVLFIDDNPHNLHEVADAVPNIHVVDARAPGCDELL